jgi:hypothetical protein
LIGREPRAAVDLDQTVAVEPRRIGLLLAQAGKGKRGPGPGFLAQTRERPRGGARGEAGRALAGRARARAQVSPFSCWASRKEWAGWAGFQGIHSVSVF